MSLTVSFTLDTGGRLKSGMTLKQAITAVDAEAGQSRPDFYGINCSHPFEFGSALDDGDWVRRIRSIRPNAAMMEKQALCKIGHLEAGDPEALGGLPGNIARRYPHIDVWGGCCGTWETHLQEIAQNVKVARQA